MRYFASAHKNQTLPQDAVEGAFLKMKEGDKISIMAKESGRFEGRVLHTYDLKPAVIKVMPDTGFDEYGKEQRFTADQGYSYVGIKRK